jgi:pyridoxine 4-dehydrogenase
MSIGSQLSAGNSGCLRLGDGPLVARVGLGAMQLPGPGVWGPPPDRARAICVLRRAVELGVTHIDTSAAYGPAIANELIRAALHPYPEHLVIATKVGAVRDDAGAFLPATHPDRLREQVHENLRQLGVERLPLVYLRVGGDGLLAPDDVPLEASLGALAELRDEGLIAQLGLSGVSVKQLERVAFTTHSCRSEPLQRARPR